MSRGSRRGEARREGARGRRVSGWIVLPTLALVFLATPLAHAADSDRPRVYLGVRIGESNPITKANDVASVALGASFDRHLGVELSADAYELFLDTPSQGRIGELGVLGLLPQIRARYPLLEDRLVPYLLGGGGIAFAQINDANVPTTWAGSGDLTSVRFMGVVGGGVEYYVSDDIALGVEGKYLMTGAKSFDASGTEQRIDMDVGVLTFGLRAFYPESDPDPGAIAAIRATRRFYLSARFGAALRIPGSAFPGVATAPEQEMLGSNLAPLFSVSIGAQLGPVLDLELSGSNYELTLRAPGATGKAEYAVFPVLLQTRLHVPTGEPRLDPYVLGGVGVESVEVNDAGHAGVELDGNGFAVIGALGAGLDYFVTRDIALGLEAKYVLSRGHTLTIDGGAPLRGNLDALFVSLGLRVFLFDL